MSQAYSLLPFLLSKKQLAICGGILLLYFLPYFILGENAHLLIHDNMDSNLAWVKMLLDHDAVFSNGNTIIPQAMNGIPRASFPVYDFSLFIFHIAGIYYGYVVNKLLMSLIAFCGMFWLIHTFVPRSREYPIILYSTSLIYALLPFWSFSMSVSGLPLAIYALLGLRTGRNILAHFGVILFYAFSSSLVLTGFFLLLVASLLLLADIVRYRKVNIPFFSGLALLTLAYLISHLPILQRITGNPIPSHRTQFTESGSAFLLTMKKSVEIFLFGQYHAQSLHMLILLPVFAALWIMISKKKTQPLFLLLLTFITITSVFYGLLQWDAVTSIKAAVMKIVPIQLQRFHFLHPVAWYILMCLACIGLWNDRNALLIRIFLFAQLSFVIMHHELITNRHSQSFKDFYCTNSMEEIKQHINLPLDQYKVLSVGMHPAVAQFHGFYTLDGYFADYPLAWKEKFRTIISGELAASEKLLQYYDNWGSRCYALNRYTEYNWPEGRYSGAEIGKLLFDFSACYEMGGRYLISPVSIVESVNKGIRFEGIYGPDKIYLYAIEPAESEFGIAQSKAN